MERKKLKIAMLGSNYIRIPPRKKDITGNSAGALESIIFLLTEELVKRGHDVTLFASGNSKTSAKLVSVTKKDSISDKNIVAKDYEYLEYLLISKAYQMAKENKFDIIHSHFDSKNAYFTPFVKTPTVVTLHSPLTFYPRNQVPKAYKKSQYYISISNAQRKPIPDLKYIKTIYHGIDYKKIKPSYKEGKFFISAGRFIKEKGFIDAIKATKSIQERLLIFGSAKKDNEYKKKLLDLSDGKKIQIKKFIERKKLLEYFSNAKALLFPIQWEEPFGLIMTEAMACGTPVIAYGRGSVPEVVKDGKTGFIVNNRTEMVNAMKKINIIDRKACRKYIEKNFTIGKMIDDYEDVYYKIINKNH